MSFSFLEFLKSLAELTTGTYLRQVWGSAPWVDPTLDAIGALLVATFGLLIVLVLIWLERKLISRLQDRIGPNRVGGKYGLLQPVADALKLLTKEIITPDGADLWAYNLAPFLIVITGLMMWAVAPFAPGVIGVDLNIGLFYVLAISSVSVVTVLLAGWGSNNKYALLGAFRGVAQMVSYEVPMILSLLVPIILARSMSTVAVVEAQTIPFIFVVPLSALIFFISSLAEMGRTPFDLLEAESEIVAGFHIEYSGMKFAMFMLAEYVSALFMSGLFVTVFLGGYHFFGLESYVTPGGFALGNIIGLISFFVKMFLMFAVLVWVRGTLPRFRIDQMMDFNWKFLVPVTLALVLVVAVVDKILPVGISAWTRAGAHLVSNVLVGAITLELLRWRGRKQRETQDGLDGVSVETAVTH